MFVAAINIGCCCPYAAAAVGDIGMRMSGAGTGRERGGGGWSGGIQ